MNQAIEESITELVLWGYGKLELLEPLSATQGAAQGLELFASTFDHDSDSDSTSKFTLKILRKTSK